MRILHISSANKLVNMVCKDKAICAKNKTFSHTLLYYRVNLNYIIWIIQCHG